MQLGAIKVLLNAFFAKLDPHPSPSNVEPLHLRNAFFQKIWHPPPLPSALRNTWQARRKVFAIGAANSGEGGGVRKEVNGMFSGCFEM